jgi:hypothetical protein
MKGKAGCRADRSIFPKALLVIYSMNAIFGKEHI